MAVLGAAAAAGAAYVDIELLAADKFFALGVKQRAPSTQFIVSSHDYESTLSAEQLAVTLDRMWKVILAHVTSPSAARPTERRDNAHACACAGAPLSRKRAENATSCRYAYAATLSPYLSPCLPAPLQHRPA
jgi:hypothetical protein